MKKSLYAIAVILFSAIGANALASKLDINVRKVSIETNDDGGSDNGRNRGVGNGSTREKWKKRQNA